MKILIFILSIFFISFNTNADEVTSLTKKVIEYNNKLKNEQNNVKQIYCAKKLIDVKKTIETTYIFQLTSIESVEKFRDPIRSYLFSCSNRTRDLELWKLNDELFELYLTLIK